MTPTPRADVGLRSERGPILFAVMVSTGLIAIDATILATAGRSRSGLGCRGPAQPMVIRFMKLASLMSNPVTPPASWVASTTSTVL